MSVFSKLKQFKDLREQGKKLQDVLADVSTTANTAGNKVALTMNGNMQITGLAIDDDMMTVANKSKLQEAIKDAHKDAMKKIQREAAVKMKESGISLPGME
ncbi:MAG: YbaB/EbfC family nucleoid-associated protein [bacterium]|nr:YbaB/EbfC family nucleoid-associated protein [bacterium]